MTDKRVHTQLLDWCDRLSLARDASSETDDVRGACAVFIQAAFSFLGTEIVALTAAEAENVSRRTAALVRSGSLTLRPCSPAAMSRRRSSVSLPVSSFSSES